MNIIKFIIIFICWVNFQSNYLERGGRDSISILLYALEEANCWEEKFIFNTTIRVNKIHSFHMYLKRNIKVFDRDIFGSMWLT